MNDRLELLVVGMTCANCVEPIEAAIRRLPGVDSARVLLVTETVLVDFDPARLEIRDLLVAVQQVGFRVATGKLEWRLTTGSASQADSELERSLGAVRGVVSAQVCDSLAKIEFLPGTRVAHLAEVVAQAGFGLDSGAARPCAPESLPQARMAEELVQRRLLVLGLGLTIPLVLGSMAGDFGLLAPSRWAMLVAATVVQFVVGGSFYRGALHGLRSGRANMDVLIMLGSSIAYFSSLGVTLGWLAGPHVYFETSAAILTLIRLGRFLETRAKGRSSQALEKLMELGATQARVVRDGIEQLVAVEEVVVGDILVVAPGDKVPVDGIVCEGRSSLDESMVSGESMPVSKGPGDEVVGATINREARIKFQATKVGENTVLAQIAQLVRSAQNSKLPLQQRGDEIGRIFVPVALAIAAFTFAIWLGVAQVGWSTAMLHAIAVLVIACPCAIGLATPTAVLVATTRAAERGILFKNGEVLERAGRVHVVVFDKTGTLTTGKLRLVDLLALDAAEADELLRLAASAESGSDHPLGRAVVKAARDKGLPLSEPESFLASGRGIRAMVEGRLVVVGNPGAMAQEGIDISCLQPAVSILQSEAKTVLVVAVGLAGELPRALGILALADVAKPGAAELVAQLRRSGLEVVMMTGDNRGTAEAIAAQLGIDRVMAELSPSDKVECIARMQAETTQGNFGHPLVMMVGDGINDAPALARADVGIALGTGTDIAMAAAGITLISGDLAGVAEAIMISRAASQTIVQNLVWALFYNLALIPIAAFGLLNPMFAAGAMAFSSLFVVSNSLKLRRCDLESMAARPRWRQALGLLPRVAAPGLALALMIAAPMLVMPGKMVIEGAINQNMSEALMMVMSIANGLIAISYASIPVFLAVFLRRRKDIPFTWVVVLFAAFILACGATHLVHIVGLWIPVNWVQAGFDSLCAAISLATAIVVWPILPKLLAIPSPEQLRMVNRQLRQEQDKLLQAQAELQKAYAEVERRVTERTAELVVSNASLQDEILERQRAEAKIRLQADHLQALVDVLQNPSESIPEYLDYALQMALGITVSKIGYIFEFSEETDEFRLASWSKDAMAECRVADNRTVYELETTGIWGEAVRQRKPILINDFQAHHPLKKGHPEGHCPLENYLTIPVFSGDDIVAVVGVANKEGGYEQVDILELTLLMDVVWKVVERKRSQSEIRVLNAELEHRVVERTTQLEAANRELEAFCYSVSHDLRAPLRHIDGYVDLLITRCREGLDEKGIHYLDTVAGAARRMGMLIDDLLRFSRTARSDLRQDPTNMDQVVQEALRQVQDAYAERDIQWEIGELEPVLGDHALLRQVWANLLGNAAKYTRTRDPARIQVRSRRENGELVFSIQDNGVGFDMKYAGKLFGVFQRLHRQDEFEGTGIGLATVQRIIQRHGGRIWAEAALDQGATFHFTLSTGAQP